MAALEQETEDVIPSLLHYVELMPDAVSEIQLGWEELPDSEGEIDKLLLAASQNYDHEVETDPVDDLDELLLQASQIFEGSELPAFTFAQSENSSGRFGAPRSSEDVERVKNDRIPKKRERTRPGLLTYGVTGLVTARSILPRRRAVAAFHFTSTSPRWTVKRFSFWLYTEICFRGQEEQR